MYHDRTEITRLLPLPLACACLLGALLWPNWREEIYAQTYYCYSSSSSAALTASATAVSPLNEPVVCEESPYLCVDGISRYIARVYADLLGRWPDPTEIDAVRAAYPQGLPDLQFAQELVASQEYRDRVVQDLTQQLLGRPATPAEQDYWASYEHREITLGLLTSPEYARRTGGTGEAFVAGVYQDLLGREAAPDERREVLARLATHGSLDVVQAIYDSEEHHGEQVDGVYLALLRMPPDHSGRAAWVRALHTGVTLEELIVAIVTAVAAEDDNVNTSDQRTDHVGALGHHKGAGIQQPRTSTTAPPTRDCALRDWTGKEIGCKANQSCITSKNYVGVCQWKTVLIDFDPDTGKFNICKKVCKCWN